MNCNALANGWLWTNVIRYSFGTRSPLSVPHHCLLKIPAVWRETLAHPQCVSDHRP
jgi:hypothetical protein